MRLRKVINVVIFIFSVICRHWRVCVYSVFEWRSLCWWSEQLHMHLHRWIWRNHLCNQSVCFGILEWWLVVAHLHWRNKYIYLLKSIFNIGHISYNFNICILTLLATTDPEVTTICNNKNRCVLIYQSILVLTTHFQYPILVFT
jgi:hypothetical protein